ncbi:hypothetical protein MSAN_00552000 [Mycena sanguinolenta]|uniref:Uncharacterized protein n=1 Tax=Mycena sanguinolenta TaxID=230812 RepID=A0A8H6Z9G2_9AGAR|nr:hypothetical protein MSAN_00552000 [Mycena sanguinolenta]
MPPCYSGQHNWKVTVKRERIPSEDDTTTTIGSVPWAILVTTSNSELMAYIEQTPHDSAERPSRASPLRDISPVSTPSTTSEMPLPQSNHTSSTPSQSAAASALISAAAPARSPVVVSSAPPSSSVSLPTAVSAPVASASASSAPPSTFSAPPSAQAVPPPAPDALLPPYPTQPPTWLSDAMQDLQTRYKDDRFELVLKAERGWRVKCLDCPGKLYVTGPDETLNNYQVHLKNRLHRRRVNDRVHQAELDRLIASLPLSRL